MIGKMEEKTYTAGLSGHISSVFIRMLILSFIFNILAVVLFDWSSNFALLLAVAVSIVYEVLTSSRIVVKQSGVSYRVGTKPPVFYSYADYYISAVKGKKQLSIEKRVGEFKVICKLDKFDNKNFNDMVKYISERQSAYFVNRMSSKESKPRTSTNIFGTSIINDTDYSQNNPYSKNYKKRNTESAKQMTADGVAASSQSVPAAAKSQSATAAAKSQSEPEAAKSQSAPAAAKPQSATGAASSQSAIGATISQSAPAAASSQSAPEATKSQSAPEAAKSQSTPEAAKSQSAPAAASSQSAPAAAMSQSATAAASSQSAPAAAMSQSATAAAMAQSTTGAAMSQSTTGAAMSQSAAAPTKTAAATAKSNDLLTVKPKDEKATDPIIIEGLTASFERDIPSDYNKIPELAKFDDTLYKYIHDFDMKKPEPRSDSRTKNQVDDSQSVTKKVFYYPRRAVAEAAERGCVLGVLYILLGTVALYLVSALLLSQVYIPVVNAINIIPVFAVLCIVIAAIYAASNVSKTKNMFSKLEITDSQLIIDNRKFKFAEMKNMSFTPVNNTAGIRQIRFTCEGRSESYNVGPCAKPSGRSDAYFSRYKELCRLLGEKGFKPMA